MHNSTGDIIQRCTTDVDRIRTFVAEQLTSVLRIAILMAMSSLSYTARRTDGMAHLRRAR